MASSLDDEFARRAALTPEQMERCRRTQSRHPSKPLAEIAVEENFVKPADVARLLAEVAGTARIGDLALERGFLTPEQLDECLREQMRTPGTFLGQILLQRRLLTTAQFLEILREQQFQMPPRRRIGKYQIEGVLGEGGMGIVFKARDVELGREVALKVLRAGELADQRMIERFHREAQHAARLHHPNIVTLYEAGRDGEILYIAMQYVPGVPMSEWLRLSQPPLDSCVRVLELAARAVHAAHEEGVVHRDLKPGNIIIDPQGQPHLVDFGLSRSLDDDHAVTRSGTQIGTPFYMSPEQVRGSLREIDAQSDVFALGILLYEILTGEVPFYGATSMEIYHKITSTDPAKPGSKKPDVPRDLEIVCLKALEKERAHRYRTAAAFAEDLRRYLAGEPIVARPPSTFRTVYQRVRRNAVASAAIASAVVIAIVAVVVYASMRVRIAEERADTAQQRERELQRRAAARPDYEAGRAFVEQARTHYEKVLDPGLDRVRALSAKAVDRLDRAVKADPTFYEAWHQLGRAHEHAGRYEEARDAYRESLRLAPDYYDANYDLARITLDEYATEQASSMFLLGPGGVTMRETRTESARAATLRTEAVACLHKAASRVQDERRRAPALALLDLIHDRYEPALRGFDEAIRDNPAHDEYPFHRGWALYALGRYEEALSAYTRSIELCANQLLGYTYRGIAHETLGNLDRAVEDYSKALVIYPDRPEILANRANVLLKRGEADAAIADLDRAIAIEPVAPYFNSRGAARCRRGEHQAAYDDYTRAIDRDAASAFLSNRALELVHLKKKDLALAEYNRALEVDPNNADAWFGRARIGDDDAALLDYAETIRCNPKYALAYLNRGNIYRRRKEHDRALDEYRLGLEADPKMPRLHFARGLVRLDRQEWEEAEADFGHAIECDAQYADAYWNRGQARIQLDRKKDAIGDLRRAAELKPSYAPAAEEMIRRLE